MMDEQRAWLRSRRKRRLRILAAILSFCVLLTSSPYIWEMVSVPVFAAEEPDGEGRQYISGFAALSKEIREQSVPLGTELYELSLPDALEAYVNAENAEHSGEIESSEDSDRKEEEESPDGGDATDGNGAADDGGDAGENGTPDGDTADESGTVDDGEEADGDTADESGTVDSGEEAGGNGAPDGDTADESGTVDDGEEADRNDSSDGGEAAEEEKADDSMDDEDSGADQSESTGEEACAGSTIQEHSALTVRTGLFVLPVYASENIQDDLHVETLYGSAESQEDAASANTGEAADVEAVTIEDIIWESSPSYDGGTAGVYVFTPVLPDGCLLAEDVTLPQITVTVEAVVEYQAVTAAGELLAKILSDYFDGLSEDEIYEVILAMDEDTRLSLTADYEALLAAMIERDEADESLWFIMDEIQRGIADAAAKMPVKAPVFFKARGAAPRASGSIPLRRISGDGNAFVYHSFRETKSFMAGETYAFLNGIYGYEDAVCALGSGAILKAINGENKSREFIQERYGGSAEVKVYVRVVTKGRDFDYCKIGGLYEVPDSGTPTEYRYFCGYGGARDCGPYYAYTYVKESITAADVSASLNDIEKRGSTDSKDYTVTVTFGGNRSMTLDAESYTVQIPDPNSDKVTIVVSDNEGNSINTIFRMPFVVRYDGNGTGVSNVPAIQPAWTGESVTISAVTPVRSGYSFINWKEEQAGTVYTKGQRISSFGAASLQLKAQWKDTQAPDFTYSKSQVMIRATTAEVEQAVKELLVITDNEPADECTVKVTVPADITCSVGDKDVTVTVTDKAGNATTKTVKVAVISLSLLIDTPDFTENTKKLSAVLASPGGDAITETGFVWGIMTSPNTTLNNGKKVTASPVTEANGVISVTADNVQKGVNYYARAYAVAGGVTYYSNEISFGIGTPKYGSFTIKNNGNNTFTVTRSGGSDDIQTVYYRTVNGSAVGGTHFTHQASSLTFAAGETSKTITVTEKGANTAYTGRPATAYTNTDRTYSVELYRVTGGGALGDTIRAGRTMTAGAGYKVNRNIYTTEKSIVNVAEASETNGKRIADTTGDQGGTTKNVSFLTNRYGERNYNTSTSLASYYTNANERNYLEKTASGWYYRYDLYAYEYEDGYEHAYMGTQALADTNYSLSADDAAVSGVDGQLWACNFLQGEREDANHYYFPDVRTGGGESAGYPKKSNGSAYDYNGKTYVDLKVDNKCYIYFGSTGKNYDIWYIDGLTSYAIVHDKNEPQIVAVAPMAGGLYKEGDTFTVSLIFDEIVDSTNSSLSSVSVETTWGNAGYTGGADTNVLYFTGVVKAGTNGTLNVTKLNNAGNIKDMCDASGTACSGGSGSTTASADTAQSNFTLTSKGVTNGTGTVSITVNDDKAKTSSLRYVWSDSTTMPVTGWVDASSSELTAAKGSSGFSVSVRKEPGSGNSNGKWYLHVIGTYDTTGATTYKYAEVNFGTPQSPTSPAAPAPTLSVSANNSAWATSRAIHITTTNAGSSTLQYRKAGTSNWISFTGSVVNVTENGWYTFRLSSKNNEYIITKDIQVEKIDRINPTGAVGVLSGGGTNQTSKAGVYTKITLPITFSDAQSGVKTVQYQWTNAQTTPTSGWQTLSASQVQAGKAELSYTASESAETKKYLHIKVTDQVDQTYTAKSAAYTVISQSAVTNHTPKITLTGAPAKWTNDMVTLEWTLTDYAGKNYEVILPDGRKARSNAVSGETWAARNGTYTVKVRDLDYGGENTATVNVQYIDTTAPTVNVSGVPADWQGSGQTVTFSASDSQSGVGKKYIKIVTSDAEIPGEGLTELTSDTVRISENGVWYVYYKYYDQTGDDSAGREANKTEGFAGPVKIDGTAPALTASYGTAGVPKSEGLPVILQAAYGMSGGNVKVNGKEIAALTAEPGDTDGEINKETKYQVTEKGTYGFVLTGGSGKTVTKSLTVYETAFVTDMETEAVTQLVAANGTLVKPDDPERTGYVFQGWYTKQSGGSEWHFDADQVTADQTLYAHWLDETPPDVPVLQDGITLPKDWTNTQKTIPLKLCDGVGVTELWVSVDGGAYRQVNGFIGSTGGAPYNYGYTEVAEGEHTYRFKAKDAAGNESDESEEFQVRLDTAKPVIGTLTYENQTANLWQYIIGKTSLIIYVPVTDTGSDVTEISFCLTPRDAAGNLDEGKAVTDTVTVKDGEAKIVFDKDFCGIITTGCTDAAGNAADGKTVGTADAGGVIVEDTAPDITTDAKTDYYDNAADIHVEVKDNTENAITAGIATVKYKVGDAAEQSVAVNTSALQEEAVFTIPAAEIPTGITRITVTATDNAGNEAAKPFNVKVRGQEKTPAAKSDYQDEKLTDLVPGAKYTIDGTEYTADGEGHIPIIDGWIGSTVSIIKKGNGNETTDSPAQSLDIPARPAKPTLTGVDVSTVGGTGKLTGLTAGTAYEVSTDGGKTWGRTETADESGEITGLAPDTYVVRVKAGTSNFASEKSEPAAIGAYQIKVTFMADGAKYREISVDYGAPLTDIPPVPAKENAVGAWCMDEQGTTPAVFTNITADMTVCAVYTTAYTVTLQTGTGYTLSAQAGSTSPVKEGGSFTFRFTLDRDYRKTDDFAVKVNGVQLELTADDTYTINDIRENETVTVEGVAKKPGGKPSNPGGGEDKEEDAPEPTPPPSKSSDDTLSTPPVKPPAKATPPAPETTPAEKEPEDGKTGTTPKQEKGGEQEPKGTGAQEPEKDGADAGQTDKGPQAEKKEVQIGNGTVIVTVVCEEEKCTATVTDTEKVVKAVLTPDQQALVNGGETIEIRIDVTDISQKVPAQDKEVIESGIEAYREEVPGLQLGMYVDISMFIKIGAGDWNAITATDEPVEVVIDIPEKLQSDGREFYIIRTHNGVYTFMSDMDNAPDTITVSTDLFSSYAITYVETDETGTGSGAKCGLCHICPTFLGICYFIWLAVIILTIIVVMILFRKKKQEQDTIDNLSTR